MADPILAKADDTGPGYLSTRERAAEQDALDFLTAQSDAHAAPVESLLQPVLKEIPHAAARDAVTKGAEASDGFDWTFENVWNAIRKGTFDATKGVFQESPRAVVGGVRDAVQEFWDAEAAFADWGRSIIPDFMEGTVIDPLGLVNEIRAKSGEAPLTAKDVSPKLPDVAEPDTVTGGMIRDVSQFITGFIPALRAAKAAGVASGTAKAVTKAASVLPKGAAAAQKVGAAAGRFAEASMAGAISDATVFDPHEERLSDLIQTHPDLQNPITEYLASNPEDSEAEARLKRALEGLGLGAMVEGLGASLRVLRAVRKQRAGAKATEGNVAQEIPPAAKSEATENAIQESVPQGLPALGDPAKPLVALVREQDLVNFQGMGFADAIEGGQRVNINLARIETEVDVKEAIAKTGKLFAARMDEAKRGVVSHAETAKLAKDLGMTPQDLLSRRKGEAFNAEEALAARQILASSGEQLVALARQAATAEAGPGELLAFRRALSTHTAIQEQVSGMTAEAGRALSAFRIMAKGTKERDRQIAELLEGSGGDLFNRDMARRLADIASENPDALNKAAREMTQVSGWDQMYEVWVNNLLSGPQTHAVNTLSNTLVSLWQIPERSLAAKIGQAMGTEGGVAAGEASAQAFGMVKGYKDGLKLFAKAVRTGEGSDLLGKVEQAHRAFTAENFKGTKAGRVVNALSGGSLDRGGIAARGVDLLAETARLPSRLLTAEDELFKAVGYRMELNAQAYRMAASEGLEGEAMAKRMADIIANPPENIHLAAVDAARYQTFTKPLGEAGQSAQKWIRKVPALRLVAPFVRTPTNILKFVGERSPLAPLSSAVRADIAAGGARRDLALAKMGLGTMTMATAADLTAGGYLTGGGPSEPKMRSILRNTGWQPYSVKIGDKYYSYNRLDPLGMMMGLAADTSEIMGQVYGEGDDADNLGAAAVMAVAKNATSKTWLTGISNLIEAIDDPDRNATRFIQRFAGTLVPTGVVQANRALMDPVLHDTKGLDLWQSMLNEIQSRTPGYSQDLPPRTNMWGEPIVLGGGLGPDIVSPIYTSEKRSSPADEELLRLKVPLSMPSRQIEGVKLTATEYHRYVELAGNAYKDPSTGKGLKDTLDALVSGSHPMSSAYKNATDGPDGGKALLIRRLVTGYRQAAKETLLREMPDLRRLVNETRQEKVRNLGSGTQ